MGRNAVRRRAERDALRERQGREVRSSLAERSGNRMGSGIKSVVGSDQVPDNAPKHSKIDAAAAALAMATWGAVRR